MHLHLIADAGYCGVGLGVVSTLIQFSRLRRDGTDGVSLGTWTLFVLTSGFWISYGSIGAHSLQIVLGSLLVVPFQIYIVGKLRPLEHLDVIAKAGGFSFLFSFAPMFVWGWKGGVYGTGVAMTLMCLPQFLELLKNKHAEGVSAVSWYVGTVQAGLWAIFYAGSHMWAPLVSAAGFGSAMAAIACLATLRHLQSR